MATWKKLVIASGSSAQYIKGDGTLGTYSTTDSSKLPLTGGTLSGKLTITPAESLELSGIRGRAVGSQTGDFIHLYERVSIGNPSGWGHANASAPQYGLSVYGSVQVGRNGSGVLQINGTTVIDSSRNLTNIGNVAFSGTLIPSVRNKGLFGIYDSYKTHHIWSIGSSYQSHVSGTNFGNLYGLAYKHTNNTTGGTMAGGHQMVWCNGGTGTSAVGDNLWTSGTVTASGGNSTNWNTAYTYSQTNRLPLTGGTLTGALIGTTAQFSGDIKFRWWSINNGR